MRIVGSAQIIETPEKSRKFLTLKTLFSLSNFRLAASAWKNFSASRKRSSSDSTVGLTVTEASTVSRSKNHRVATPQSRCFALFSLGSSGYQLGCTETALSVQQPVELVSNDLQNIMIEGMPHSLQCDTKLWELGVSVSWKYIKKTISVNIERTQKGELLYCPIKRYVLHIKRRIWRWQGWGLGVSQGSLSLSSWLRHLVFAPKSGQPAATCSRIRPRIGEPF